MTECGYRLIVSDFDGTLRRSEGGISDANVQAVKKYVAAGGIFAFCTGRMLSSILPYARELGLEGLIVAYQGAVIAEIGSGKILRDVRLGWRDAAEICDYLQELKRHIHVYDGDLVYMNRDDEMRAYYERVCGVTGILTGEDIASFVRERKICPQKVLSMNMGAENEEIFQKLHARYKEKYNVTSSSDVLVELTVRGCDKGGALEFLAEYYHIPLEETVAIGDNYNDIPMIRKAGLGVAVENAVAAAKDAADFITKSCDDDGVAYVINKFGLGESI